MIPPKMGTWLAAATEICEVDSRGVWVLLERRLIFADRLECLLHRPKVDAADVQILVRVHFDVVNLREGHPRNIGKYAAKHLLACSRQLHVLEVDAPLFPSRGNEVWANK